jgi:hypothetical protein
VSDGVLEHIDLAGLVVAKHVVKLDKLDAQDLESVLDEPPHNAVYPNPQRKQVRLTQAQAERFNVVWAAVRPHNSQYSAARQGE